MRPGSFVSVGIIALLSFLCAETITPFAFGEVREIAANQENSAVLTGPCPSCSRIGDEWYVNEWGTVKCLVDGRDNREASYNFDYLTTVQQENCNVVLSTVYQGSGPLTGSSLQLSGSLNVRPFDPFSNLPFSQISLAVSGTVSGRYLNLQGSGTTGGTFHEAGSTRYASCTVEYSARLRRKNDVPVAGKATLIAPTGTIATHKPTYSWNAVANADCYLLAAKSNVTGKWPISQMVSATEAGCGGGFGTCSFTPSIPLPSGNSEWYIQTANYYGFVNWSSPASFTVNQPVPAKPVLIAPTGNIEANKPTYSWHAAAEAEGYQLVADDSTGKWPLNQLYSAAEAGCASGTGTCSITPAIPLAPGNCKWYVRAWNYSDYGPWSDGMTFTTPPGRATLAAPSGSIGTTEPTFSWNAVAKAEWYQLAVQDATGSWPILDWWSAAEAGCGSGTGLCSASPQIALKPGIGKWYIQTWNSSGDGPWSDGLAFGVLTPGTATLVSPGGGIGTNKPTYSWNAVSNADYYKLAVKDATGAWPIQNWYSAAEAGCGSGTGTCSLNPQIGLTSGSHNWYIQTYNSNGVGFWSEGMAFSVP